MSTGTQETGNAEPADDVSPRKCQSCSNSPKLPNTPRMLPGMRSWAGRVSGSRKATSNSAISAATPTATNAARQPNGMINALPVNGARIGDTENTSITSDISLVASAPVWRSRMIARGITPIAAPIPCRKRNAISQPMVAENAQPIAPRMKSVSPPYSGSLRP
jgi:hypothetical protein